MDDNRSSCNNDPTVITCAFARIVDADADFIPGIQSTRGIGHTRPRAPAQLHPRAFRPDGQSGSSGDSLNPAFSRVTGIPLLPVHARIVVRGACGGLPACRARGVA